MDVLCGVNTRATGSVVGCRMPVCGFDSQLAGDTALIFVRSTVEPLRYDLGGFKLHFTLLTARVRGSTPVSLHDQSWDCASVCVCVCV